MNLVNSAVSFNEQMERIKLITGKRTQVELADLLGVRQSSVSDAKRRGRIPSGWLVTLMRYKHANPEWILTGNGPTFISFSPVDLQSEAEGEAEECRADTLALRRLPSRMLADELVRRIVVSQERKFCAKEGE